MDEGSGSRVARGATSARPLSHAAILGEFGAAQEDVGASGALQVNLHRVNQVGVGVNGVHLLNEDG